jgi:hypothetical protein
MAEDNDAPNRKKRDPILMVGTIVLALALVVVISGYAYAEYVYTDNTPMEYGDKLKVDYVGSFHGWYDGYNPDDPAAFNGDKGTIFDTSLWSVARTQGEDTEDHKFANEFTKRTEDKYVPFDVTVGSGSALTAFENAVIGKKPGETVYVKIENGYGVVPKDNLRTWSTTEMKGWDRTEKMTVNTFMATFGMTSTAVTHYTNLEHPYGWKCDAVVGSDGYVFVTHHVNLTDPEIAYKSVKGGMTVKVTANGTTKFDLKIEFDEEYDADGIFKLIQFKYLGKTYYVTGVTLGADGKQTGFTFKDTEEIKGMHLYFKITVVGYQ